MKNPLLQLLVIVSFFSCGTKEDIQRKAAEDLVVQIMVTGQWVVTNYTKGTTDLTTDFSPYKFQFHDNRTVDALKLNTLEKSGTWDANSTARTITSNFVNANATLSLLNGTWTITNSTLTTVEANKISNGEVSLLKLVKQ
jgi:hypothetical protein